MRTTALVGALVAAGVIGAGAATYGKLEAPFSHAHAAPALAAGVAAPAANPAATTLPLNGFSDLVKKYGPAVVNVSVEGTRRVASQGPEGLEEIPPQFREFFRGFGGRGMPRGDVPLRGQGSGFVVS